MNSIAHRAVKVDLAQQDGDMLLPDFAKPLFDAFAQEGEELYLVGGAVRDWMLHQMYCDPAISDPVAVLESFETKDLDFATSARPEKTRAILEKHGFKPYDLGVKFGTIGTHLGDVECDITTYRSKEKYPKGSRKPEVTFGDSIIEDLARRDFTINSIAMAPDGSRIDPHEGFSALVQGLLMATSDDPAEAFTDDPLRMLRYFRFASQLPVQCCRTEFDCVTKLKHLIHDVSHERVFDEMSKLLMTRKPSRGLQPMADSGLLGEIFPSLQTVIDFKQNQGKWHSKLVWPHTLDVVDNTPAILPVRWAALFHDVSKPETYSETDTGVHFYHHEYKGAKRWLDIAAELKVSTAFRDEVYYLIHDHLRPALLAADDSRINDRSLRRLLRDAGPYLDNLFHLSLADITSHKPDIVEARRSACLALKARLDALEARHQVSALKLPTGFGRVVGESLGLAGPKLGALMRKVNDLYVEGCVPETHLLHVARALHDGVHLEEVLESVQS